MTNRYILIILMYLFLTTMEQMDYKENIEQVNSNQQDSKEENIITTSPDIDTN